MTHPITPPPELVQQISLHAINAIPDDELGAIEIDEARDAYIASFFAQWGADQELEATDAWIRTNLKGMLRPANRIADDLRAARRPKPPSLKEQALEALVSINSNFHVYGADIDIIRRALEALSE